MTRKSSHTYHVAKYENNMKCGVGQWGAQMGCSQNSSGTLMYDGVDGLMSGANVRFTGCIWYKGRHAEWSPVAMWISDTIIITPIKLSKMIVFRRLMLVSGGVQCHLPPSPSPFLSWTFLCILNGLAGHPSKVELSLNASSRCTAQMPCLSSIEWTLFTGADSWV